MDLALAEGKSSPLFWKFPILLAEAKGWERNLDRPFSVKNRREYPPEQIEWYLNNTLLDYGVLTNGRQWRLTPRELAPDQPRFQTYFECNLQRLLEDCREKQAFIELDPIFEDFFQFYFFFSPLGYTSIQNRIPLIERAKKGSSEYRLGIGQDLRNRVFEAVRLCIEGFLRFPENKLKSDSDLPLCREQSFIFLYRLLFIMYAEDRQLLPYHINRLYTENRSLGRLRDDIAFALDRVGKEAFSKRLTNTWDDLQSLFDLIDNGHKRYGVPAYNGGLFNTKANEFLTHKRISDWYLAQVIDQLGRAEDEQHPALGLYRVDYRDLQIQHLGNIYEGLLESHPQIATERMVVIRPTASSRRLEEKSIPTRNGIPRGYESMGIFYESGEAFLATNKGERRASGSYYTPNHIVDYIVEKTLAPICQKISNALQKEIDLAEKHLTEADQDEREALEIKIEKLKGEYGNRLLQLKILDPAMGSGHFLLGACQFLAEEIATHPYTADPDSDDDLPAESAISFWKRRVVEHCLYGVDKNLLAVELAKLALWLETVSKEQPLSFLEHHLRHGNSLVGAKLSEMHKVPNVGSLFEGPYSESVIKKLPVFLKPLESISNIPSNSTRDIRMKDQLYRRFLAAREPFLAVADLWCSTFYAEEQLGANEYKEAIMKMNQPKVFKRLMERSTYKKALECVKEEDALFFHWELEFPELFLARPEGSRGFEAIIGNPPYDVLSEKEIGYDLSSFRAFVENYDPYKPSRRGKNNLYKLFICRAIELLASDGMIGLITPMAVLGDDQAAGIRRKIIDSGVLTSIDAFPQKDNPYRRVFPEAKLSTVVFTLSKTENDRKRNNPFLSRVHSENIIDPSSPTLRLRMKDIPLYDSSNLSIVSCSQEDWDMATRMMNSGRLARLGKYCEQFQGEVNETNESNRNAISEQPEKGPLILRGSNVSLYLLREASQGSPLYLMKKKFLKGKSGNSKAYAFREPRIGFQRSSPQNNFRRIIAAFIESNNFCFDTISYIPRSNSKLPLYFLLGLLNSKLLDWYFRLGSTNSKVNEYQFKNLPCPILADTETPNDLILLKKVKETLKKKDVNKTYEIISASLEMVPFAIVVRDTIVEAVKCIIAIEKERRRITRRERSALDSTAQPYQDFIDRCIYAMAGLGEGEIRDIEGRLARML